MTDCCSGSKGSKVNRSHPHSLNKTDVSPSYRADIILMLNRGMRRLTVRQTQRRYLEPAYGYSRSTLTRYEPITEGWRMASSIRLLTSLKNSTKHLRISSVPYLIDLRLKRLRIL